MAEIGSVAFIAVSSLWPTNLLPDVLTRPGLTILVILGPGDGWLNARVSDEHLLSRVRVSLWRRVRYVPQADMVQRQNQPSGYYLTFHP